MEVLLDLIAQLKQSILTENLITFMKKALPGRKILAPPEAVFAPSNFPIVDGKGSMNHAKTRLHQLTGFPFTKCEDMIRGYCETCGCVISKTVIAAIQNRDTPVLDIAYDYLANVLEKRLSKNRSISCLNQ